MPALHEYVLCAETLRAVLRRRDNFQADVEAKSEALANKMTEKDGLKEEIDKLEDKMEFANNALKGDWERWQKNMRADIKEAFMSTAEKNVDYYEKCLAVWESFLLSLRSDLSSESNREQAPSLQEIAKDANPVAT